ncbi:MAG: P-loop NTPase, partial [Proteobacteria bacterium]|nr:P-loop NTPase [Pseudomonadota bacterium]
MSSDGRCESCDDSTCGAQSQRPGEGQEEFLSRKALAARLCQIDHKIMVLSGKGGVGKSTVAVNLAATLAMSGKRVGLLDVDIHGPSVPKLLHLEGSTISGNETTIFPVTLSFGEGTLSVMSIAFMLRGRDDAVIWRGPRKYGVIKQFLRDVEWGEL